MTLTELEKKCPKLLEYTKHACRHPQPLHRAHPCGRLHHPPEKYGAGLFRHRGPGENRVINEFENGNVYMIEGNKAIDFIGEVTNPGRDARGPRSPSRP